MAVLAPHRGHGLAGELCRAVEVYVREYGGAEVWCHAQAGDRQDVRGFYRRLGYGAVGDVYMKDGGEFSLKEPILSGRLILQYLISAWF